MAEVDVGGGRVDPELHPQRPAPRELLGEGALRQHVDRVASQAPGLFAGPPGAPRGVVHPVPGGGGSVIGPMLDCALGSAGVRLAALARARAPSLRVPSPPPSRANRQPMASSRRKEPRPEGKAEPQGGRGDDGDRDCRQAARALRRHLRDRVRLQRRPRVHPGAPAEPEPREAAEGNGAGSAPAVPRRDRIARRVERERPAEPGGPGALRRRTAAATASRPAASSRRPLPHPRFPPSATGPG